MAIRKSIYDSDIDVTKPLDYQTYKFADTIMEKAMTSSDDFSLHVRIVDSHEYGSHIQPVNPNRFDIIIDKSQLSTHGFDMFAMLCHEIGHAIAYKTDQPGNAPHMFMPMVYRSKKGVIQAEEEAWVAAEKIFQATRDVALDSYRTSMPAKKVLVEPLNFGDKP